MKNIEIKINEVNQYFKDKLLAGEFTILKMKEHTCKIEIDGQYQFNVWIGNFTTIPDSTRLYEDNYNFMHIELSKEESIQLNSILKPAVLGWRKNILIEQKRAELEQLLNEEL